MEIWDGNHVLLNNGLPYLGHGQDSIRILIVDFIKYFFFGVIISVLIK